MKADLTNEQITDFLRYWELFLLGDSRTQEEQLEFETLKSTLSDNMVSADDINNITLSIESINSTINNINSTINNMKIRLYMEV